MTIPLTALAAKPVPGYCASGHGILTPAQWKTCWDIGWGQPTTTAANAGAFAGHNVMPFLIGLAILAAIVTVARMAGRSTTVQPSK